MCWRSAAHSLWASSPSASSAIAAASCQSARSPSSSSTARPSSASSASSSEPSAGHALSTRSWRSVSGGTSWSSRSSSSSRKSASSRRTLGGSRPKLTHPVPHRMPRRLASLETKRPQWQPSNRRTRPMLRHSSSKSSRWLGTCSSPHTGVRHQWARCQQLPWARWLQWVALLRRAMVAAASSIRASSHQQKMGHRKSLHRCVFAFRCTLWKAV
mmetsp:Transcript_28296/g.65181  ORF Transcript_28296/g.65181 Transcript_28296/m.65181 type:complete len:214 (+) Transcript_28296:2401-3042(+)